MCVLRAQHDPPPHGEQLCYIATGTVQPATGNATVRPAPACATVAAARTPTAHRNATCHSSSPAMPRAAEMINRTQLARLRSIPDSGCARLTPCRPPDWLLVALHPYQADDVQRSPGFTANPCTNCAACSALAFGRCNTSRQSAPWPQATMMPLFSIDNTVPGSPTRPSRTLACHILRGIVLRVVVALGKGL